MPVLAEIFLNRKYPCEAMRFYGLPRHFAFRSFGGRASELLPSLKNLKKQVQQKQLPSTSVISWAIRDARLCRNAEWQLLIAIGLRVNPKDRFICWPSYKTLSLDTGVHPSTLKKAAEALEKKGLIKRRVRHNQSNIFTLNWERILKAAEIFPVLALH